MSLAFSWREAPVADFAVIGDPVEHSLSPRMHQAAYKALRLPCKYVAVHVPRGEVMEALDHLTALHYRGVNVTIPHKEQALAWSRHRDRLAERLGAANTLRLADRSCINTDLPGFWDTLANVELPNRRALVLGAGGSARSVVLSLIQRGFEVAVWNRTRSNAEAMVTGLGVQAEILSKPELTDAGLVVNTTAASLQGSNIPLEWDGLRQHALCYDLMYSDGPTPFLAEAGRRGFQTMDGRPLLVAQGARSFEYWLDMRAPRDVMLQAIAPNAEP
jgi:shikimate dehydrogenase